MVHEVPVKELLLALARDTKETIDPSLAGRWRQFTAGWKLMRGRGILPSLHEDLQRHGEETGEHAEHEEHPHAAGVAKPLATFADAR